MRILAITFYYYGDNPQNYHIIKSFKTIKDYIGYNTVGNQKQKITDDMKNSFIESNYAVARIGMNTLIVIFTESHPIFNLRPLVLNPDPIGTTANKIKLNQWIFEVARDVLKSSGVKFEV